jgi:hypothetical protein
MRLRYVTVHGYKRFATPNTLYVGASLVAIVGPNEAGKTSLLDAMRHLSVEPPKEEDPENPNKGKFRTREFSGRKFPERDEEENPLIVSARFSLERDDWKAIEGIDGVDKSLELEVTKRADSGLRWQLYPRPKRDLKTRDKVLGQLGRVVENAWLSDEPLPDEEGNVSEESTSLHGDAVRGLEALKQAGEDLGSDLISNLREFADALEDAVADDDRKTVQGLPDALRGLADIEDTPNPWREAGRILNRRRPIFLLFDDAQRTLRSFYSWDEDLSENPALANLLSLADVTFSKLGAAATDPERTDELQTMEYLANETLEKEFEAWHQSDLSVSLRAQAGGLEIQIRDRETKKHTRLEERSAGLRSFVALIAFCATHSGGQTPILLIDEAENHLHYEGQANLLKVFERQSVAQSVIYTTHSIGCLPEDLGTSIRVVAPTSSYESEVRNSFWSGDAVGLTPLMLAMGATAMAFTPSRNAVIGEGKTEAILLPTLLREARGRDPYEHLGYQVVPGLAEVPAEDVPELEADAGEVVFLIDSDKGGKSHATSKLSERAQRDGRVFELGNGQIQGLCIEDLVRADLLAAAINQVLDQTRPSCVDRLAAGDLPDVSRSKFLEDWCEQRKIEPISKPRIAQVVLDHAREQGKRILAPDHKQVLRDLHKQFTEAFPGTRSRRGK